MIWSFGLCRLHGLCGLRGLYVWEFLGAYQRNVACAVTCWMALMARSGRSTWT